MTASARGRRRFRPAPDAPGARCPATVTPSSAAIPADAATRRACAVVGSRVRPAPAEAGSPVFGGFKGRPERAVGFRRTAPRPRPMVRRLLTKNLTSRPLPRRRTATRRPRGCVPARGARVHGGGRRGCDGVVDGAVAERDDVDGAGRGEAGKGFLAGLVGVFGREDGLAAGAGPHGRAPHGPVSVGAPRCPGGRGPPRERAPRVRRLGHPPRSAHGSEPGRGDRCAPGLGDAVTGCGRSNGSLMG